MSGAVRNSPMSSANRTGLFRIASIKSDDTLPASARSTSAFTSRTSANQPAQCRSAALTRRRSTPEIGVSSPSTIDANTSASLQ